MEAYAPEWNPQPMLQKPGGNLRDAGQSLCRNAKKSKSNRGISSTFFIVIMSLYLCPSVYEPTIERTDRTTGGSHDDKKEKQS